MAAYSQNAPEICIHDLMIGNRSTSKVLETHRVELARAMAAPRIRLGNISERITQVTGARVSP